VFDFGLPRNLPLASGFKRVMDVLRQRSEYLSYIRSTGGRCEILIGVFLNKESGFVLNNEIVSQLGKLGLDLDFRMYPPVVVKRPK
jgi:hypothetical protein